MMLVPYAAWQVFRWPSFDRTIVGDLFFSPMGAMTIAAGWSAARRCAGQPRLRSAWRLLTFGAAAFFAGQLAQTVYEAAGEVPYPSVADGFYLLFYPLMLAGLLRFPTRHQTVAERVRLVLDLIVVAVGGSAAVVYLVLAPTIAQTTPDVLESAISIAYPVGDMVLLVGLASVLLRARGASSSTRALQFMAAGLLLFVIGDVIYGYLTLHSAYHGGDPVDAFWLVALALFAMAGSAQGSSEAGTDSQVVARRQRASWAPFLAVAVAFGLLLVDHRHDPLLPSLVLLISAVLLASLVAARQFLAQRDLLRTQGPLTHQSLHDALTGLANRALLIDRAERLLARARRRDTSIAALYVDVDGFKLVNDSFGHAAGDELLQVVAARLAGLVREADTVGRLGGDEFVVLLDELTLDAGPELVAQRICDVVSQPADLQTLAGREVLVTASVGIALGQHSTAEDLFRDADCALYEAKRAGKNRWVAFESTMQTLARDRLELEMDLRDALDTDQLFLLYQPIFELETETPVGVEALIRWRHPTRGIIAPPAFIPLAETTGAIVAIGRWVLHTACRQAAAWHRSGHPLNISVNVSARQLAHPEFVDDVIEALITTGLDATALTLEITETVLMRDIDNATQQLSALKAHGVQIAIDDFGTGYSSLAYLRQLPINALKIDRSFISAIAAPTGFDAMIHTLIQLGRDLGLRTVGEGIEDPSQLQHLQREHCDLGQGFLLAHPLDASAIDALLPITPSQQPAQPTA